MPSANKAREGNAAWDQAARWYDALVGMQGSEYQQSLVLPGALKLLDLKKNEKVLDVACGQGFSAGISMIEDTRWKVWMYHQP